MSLTAGSLSLFMQHNSPALWDAVVRPYPDGLTIVVVPPVRERDDLKPKPGPPSQSDGAKPDAGAVDRAAARAAHSHAESVRRSRATVKDLARKNGLGRLSTFTFPTSIPERRRAQGLFSRWIEKYGRRWFPSYLLVYELHKSGCWHVHLLDPGEVFLPWREIRRSWTRYLVRCGVPLSEASEVARTHHGKKRLHDPGAYAAKYVGEDFGQELEPGTHRYERSQNLEGATILRLSAARLRALLRSGWLLGHHHPALLLTGYYDGRQDGLPFLHYSLIWDRPPP